MTKDEEIAWLKYRLAAWRAVAFLNPNAVTLFVKALKDLKGTLGVAEVLVVSTRKCESCDRYTAEEEHVFFGDGTATCKLCLSGNSEEADRLHRLRGDE